VLCVVRTDLRPGRWARWRLLHARAQAFARHGWVATLAALAAATLSLASAAQTGAAPSALPAATPASASLRTRFEAVRQQPPLQATGQALWLSSFEQADGRLRGEVWAVVEHDPAAVRAALSEAAPWCDVLILHLNVKYCRAGRQAGQDVLDMGVGRKLDQPLASVHWMRLQWRLASAQPEAWRVELWADEGPLQTRDYRIEMESAPLGAQRTLVRLGYSYAYGAAARWAMQLYLGTLGHDKVGFTVLGRLPDGRAQYVGGLRGVLERNAVRYALAVHAYLDALARPAPEQLALRLEGWFDATERHARQLHELGREDYLAMKREEVQRQQRVVPPLRRE
jgi:hypothetical protein